MSDQNKNIEQLRELLKKKLSENIPADNGWNVPSDDVWGGISDELTAQKPPGKSNGMMYLLGTISLALLAVLFMRECAYKRQVNEMQMGIEKLENSYNQLKENCGQTSSPETEVSPKQIQSNESLTPGPQPESKKQTSPLSPTNRQQQNKNNSQTSPPSTKPLGALLNESEFIRSMNNTTLNVGSVLLSTNVANFELEELLRKKNTPRVKVPAQLPSSALAPLKHETTADINLPIPEAGNNSLVLVPSTYAAVSFTGNRLSGTKPSIISDQKALFAYRGGLGLEAVLSPRWSLQTGLHYATSRIQTNYQLEVAFTHENEYVHEDGNVDNQYNHSLPSSMGNYPAQFVLSRASDAVIHEGEVMNLDLSIRQRTQFLTLPFHIRYGFGKSRLRAGIKAGFVANHTLNVSSETPSLVSNHSEIHQRHASIGDPTSENLENNTLDASIGLDIRYQIAPRINLSLETNYQRGLTPIYQDDTVKNYLDAGNLGMGFQFIF